MTRLRWLVGAAVLLAVACGVTIAGCADSRPRPGAAPPQARGSNDTASARPADEQTNYVLVPVTITIPAAADVPTGGAHGGNCPQDKFCNILGVTLSAPHGLVVKSVVPDGPADKAGIKPGDRLGDQSACPRTALPMFRAGAEPREMELKVRRPGEGVEESGGAEQPPGGGAGPE